MREQHPIHEELKEIFRQAKRATSEKERKRLIRQGMNRMMTAPPQCFWPGMPPQYRDDLIYIEAAAVAWDYIERKIYGNIRGKGTAEEKAYDPDKDNAASPITLWNIRCEGEYKDRLERERRLIDPNPKSKNPDEDFNIDDVPQPQPELSSAELIEENRQIIAQDAEGKYRNTFVRQNPPPPITAQEVMLEICDRVSRGEDWTLKILAEHFNVPRGTMNAAWARDLKPLLRGIGNILIEKM